MLLAACLAAALALPGGALAQAPGQPAGQGSMAGMDHSGHGAPAAPAQQQGHAGHPAPAPAPAPAMDHSGHGAPAAPTGHEGHGATAPSSAPMPPMAMLTPEQAKLIGVTVTQAATRPFKAIIRATGRVAPDETRLATVTTKAEGYVERLMVDHTGQPVKKGQPLLAIYSPEVYATQLEYLNLLRWRSAQPKAAPEGGGEYAAMLANDSQALLAAARQRLALLDAGGLAAQLEKNGKPSRDYVLVSPVDGYVISRQATLGMQVAPGEKLYDLADLSTVWVLADVYEENLPYFKEGQTALITLTGVSGPPLTAKVAQIYPVIAADTRTAKVRFVLPNPKGLLRPEMYAEIQMGTDLGQRLAVPESAIIDTGVRKVVYYESSPNNFEPQDVTTGIRSGGFVEILSGLSPGTKVATSASFLLDAETRLKSSGGGGEHHH
ncbi:efflux RND transporter periplasmic adaptor subunit [Fundidesulfovibrio soli]|uniref:efflux RND transporter periplasmic adaptor subunit n=1 Tax=Fundidesulfovibrio soli TaxID=2922716 RepID=UPI001FAF7C9B|nr:efflux RND transporter periplasmic adaptor subunit [Fundidesulfovibrio soli]